MKCSLLWIALSVHRIAGSDVDVSKDLPLHPKHFELRPRVGKQESTLACGQKADLSEGDVILESPNYPGLYPNREKCKWLLRTGSVDDVYVSCESFDVLRRDFLKIWFDRYYGTVSEPVYFTVKSWYNKVRVLFKSNRRDQGTGFRCTFSVNGFTNNPTTPATTTITTGGPTNITTPPPTGDCQCGIKGDSDSTRIVGGQETEVHEYPWQVGLVGRGRTIPFCGGSLISERHVLTAAHCTEDSSARRIQVLLGEHRIDDGEFTRVDVANINEDPDYDFPDGDFSILTLSQPVTFSSSVRPVCLPSDTTKTYEGEVATVTGWGTLSSGGSQPDVLMEVDVTVTTNDFCNGVYDGDINSLHICAMDAGKDSCQGDSGGPLIVKENGRWTLVGVVSFGNGCALPGVPGVYARVTQRFDWIKDNTAGTLTSTCQAA